MSARGKRVISTEEIQFNHKPAKILLTKKEGSQPKWPNCSYCVLHRPVFERSQTLLHPELIPWWSFLLVDWCPSQETSQPHPPLQYLGSNNATTVRQFRTCLTLQMCYIKRWLKHLLSWWFPWVPLNKTAVQTCINMYSMGFHSEQITPHQNGYIWCP